ncbi:MAG TPA: hypothetical protein VFE62_08685 [Gemmataceae bacterium]|nr:hypothetical protein [Gemmataceae bacterium]
MHRHFLTLACVAATALPAGAQTFDRAAFRQAIGMPTVSISFNIQFRANERDGQGRRFDAKEKLAELQKKLTGGPTDAEIYLDMRGLYLECLQDEKSAKAMLDKAQAVLAPIRETTNPNQAWLLTQYGSLLEMTVGNPWKDCELLARRAVTLAPQDWRGWAYLAHVRHQQIPSALCNGDEKILSSEHRTHEVIGMLVLKRCQPEQVEAAERLLNEALQYHDKARDLAPNEPKRQTQRYGFRLAETVLRNAFAAARGQKAPHPLQQLDRVMLDELLATAKLHPDHVLWQSQLVHQLTVAGWQANRDLDSKKFRPARPEDLTAIREGLARLEKLASDSSGDTAIYCNSLLTALYYSIGEATEVEKHARKMIAIDGKNQLAREQLLQSLVMQERNADYLQAAQDLAQVLPCARNCFLLAKALAANHRYDLAEQACVAGLKADKTDINCQLGLAALTLRKSDDAAALKLTEDLLTLARGNCRPEHGPVIYTEIQYLSAVHDALSDRTVLGRVALQNLQRENPDSNRYDKLLSALGR